MTYPSNRHYVGRAFGLIVDDEVYFPTARPGVALTTTGRHQSRSLFIEGVFYHVGNPTQLTIQGTYRGGTGAVAAKRSSPKPTPYESFLDLVAQLKWTEAAAQHFAARITKVLHT